ncbi:hypothetical protein [Brevundimonas lenta]|uniref:Uncharacterized protein n=1 Tax=Brevundimonas lenta TaxID=424796 RepID=A0A7W6NP27_9CAUL|nr:hypothetical protein [Brevundimonas lenta]MBB4082980.1 hypothetical protein [Brevundimonas lenta]
MDKFTGRRRATWQSKLPPWPFVIVAFVLAGVGCWLAGPLFSGIVFGDGTNGGRAMVWMKTASNIVLPAVLVGVAVGALLNAIYLAPAGRHGALMWTALLVGLGVIVGAPASVARGFVADKVGYEMRLQTSAAEARAESRRSEADLNHRLGLLLHNNPFEPSRLAAEDGLEDARKAIAGHRDLIAAARRDYGPGQVKARAALAGAIVGEMDREAVLDRFDEAAGPRKALMERIWAAHDRIIALREDELAALSANRSGWRKAPGGAEITSRPLLVRIRRIEAGLDQVFDEVRTAEIELAQLDYETDAGIDRVLKAAK